MVSVGAVLCVAGNVELGGVLIGGTLVLSGGTCISNIIVYICFDCVV